MLEVRRLGSHSRKWYNSGAEPVRRVHGDEEILVPTWNVMAEYGATYTRQGLNGKQGRGVIPSSVIIARLIAVLLVVLAPPLSAS